MYIYRYKLICLLSLYLLIIIIYSYLLHLPYVCSVLVPHWIDYYSLPLGLNIKCLVEINFSPKLFIFIHLFSQLKFKYYFKFQIILLCHFGWNYTKPDYRFTQKRLTFFLVSFSVQKQGMSLNKVVFIQAFHISWFNLFQDILNIFFKGNRV